jgi:hypothetical protein
MNTHVFIATPMFGGLCAGYYTQSVMELQNVLREASVSSSFSFMFNESLIQRARNALVHAFLKTEATHLMFIDADLKFQAQEVLPMLAADKEIICGIYPKKEIYWPSVRKAIANGVPDNELKHHTGSFVVNLVGYTGQVTVAADQPCEIWNGGTGFMLIKREVFEKLKPTCRSYMNDVLDVSGNIGVERITEYFPVMIEEETERLLSEDYAFCKIARDAGIKVWGAPWVRLGHIGHYLFDGKLISSP